MGDSVGAASIGSAILERRGALGKGVGLLIDLSLIVICGILLARIIWSLLAPGSTVAPEATSRGGADRLQAGASYQANPRILTEFNPFDRLDGGPVVPVQEEAPETSLNLSIASIWASNDPGQTFARIRKPDNSVAKLFAGDDVVSGVKIDRILSDRVILIRNGQRETLFVSEKRLLGTVTPEGERIVNPTPSTRLPDVEDLGSQSSVTGSDQLILSKSVQLSSLEEFNTAIDVVRRAGPDGRPQMVVTAGTSADIQSLVSIAPGDILVSVNGQLFSEESPAELYQSMQQERVLTFVLQRGSQTFTRIITIEPGVGD